MRPTVYYCYDAYCGWCYGFSRVITRIFEDYCEKLAFETLSGGMILPDHQRHISHMSGYISEVYKRVEELSGVRFGEEYLWHIKNPDLTDWYLNSEKAAIAMCVFKDYFPEDTILFAADLQYAMHFEGRDLMDDEAYRHLLVKWKISGDEFFEKLHDEAYKEKAYYEFALVKQLRVTGFPSLLVQVSESRFFLVAQGFTPYEDLKKRIEAVLDETIKANQKNA